MHSRPIRQGEGTSGRTTNIFQQEVVRVPGGGWDIAGLTASDLLVVALMVVVFALAVMLPYPRSRR